MENVKLNNINMYKMGKVYSKCPWYKSAIWLPTQTHYTMLQFTGNANRMCGMQEALFFIEQQWNVQDL